MSTIVLNPDVLKAISAVHVANKRLQERCSSEENLERKRQKCISECIALKTVDYDDLSDSCKSGVEPNFTNLEPLKSVVTPK